MGGALARPLASLLERPGFAADLAAGGGGSAWWKTYTPRASSDGDAQFMVPIVDTSVDAQWHSSEASGATAFCAAINEGPGRDDQGATQIFTAGAGVGSACLLRMSPIARPAVGQIVFHTLLKGVTGSTSCQLTMTLVQNSGSNWTTRQTFSVSTSATTVYVDYQATVCASVQRLIEASASDGYHNLYIRFQKANQGNIQISSFYGSAPAANVRDMLIPDKVWHTGSGSLDMGNPEISQDGKAVSWYERKSNGSSFDGFVALLDPGASLGTDNVGKAFSVGRYSANLPQMGETSRGPFAVELDPNGFIVTTDINESNVALSSVHTWSTSDPDAGSASERAKRKAPFALKHRGISDRILVYRYETGTGSTDLYAVNLDQGWNRVLVDHHSTAPAGRGDALTYNTPRAIPDTFEFYAGKYLSSAALSPCQIARYNLVSAALNSVTIEMATSGTFHHGGVSVFMHNNLRHFCCNRASTGGVVGNGIVVYRENATTSVFDLENKYKFASAADWIPEYINPGIAQSVEATDDGEGNTILCWGVSDTSQALNAFNESSPSVICGAFVGCASAVAVISRRSTWQTKFEPEPFTRNGVMYCQYGKSRNSPQANFIAINQEGRILRLPTKDTFMARYAAILNAFSFTPTASSRYAIPAGTKLIRLRTNSDMYVNFGDISVTAGGANIYFANGTEDWNVPPGATYIALRGVQNSDTPVVTFDPTGFRSY